MANRRSSGGGGIAKYVLMMVFVAVLVLGIFLMMTRPWQKPADEETLILTPLQRITTRNLEINYPENEREVVSFFSETMQLLYGNDCSEKEIEEVAGQLMMIYDPDLLLNQANYVTQLKREVSSKRSDGFTIQRYVVPEKGEVIYFSQDGYECAGMDKVLYSIRQGSQLETVYYTFILRKDETGRWRIFGWEPSEDQTVHLFGLQ